MRGGIESGESIRRKAIHRLGYRGRYKQNKGDNAGLQPFFREGGASPDAWEDADALLKAKDIDEVSPASHQRRRRSPSRPAS